MKSPWKMNVYGITKFVLIFELLVILGLDIIEIYGMRLVFPFLCESLGQHHHQKEKIHEQ